MWNKEKQYVNFQIHDSNREEQLNPVQQPKKEKRRLLPIIDIHSVRTFAEIMVVILVVLAAFGLSI